MKTTAELREGYLRFFESKGHVRHPSSPLVPRPEDTSTLLTSAGMQPLMPYFLGREQPPAPLLTTVQKVFRTPDIDEVGPSGRYLTFLEMLGNFSFGQYFKEGAIDLAWEFVNEYMQIDLERFWVTVFAGDAELGLDEDEVAAEHWERIGMPRERIRRLGRADNFWSVGGPGPCGPDTELFYDRGKAVGCGRPECGPGCDCERFLEFWNLVFMEYELHADGKVTPLPSQNVDTGMGLERASAVLQGVISVYETDGFQAIMDWIAAESGVAYGESDRATKAHRILADHGRGMTFLAADGVAPSNEGRGYVLRRIIRRAVQQARAIGLDELWRISDVVIQQMSPWYPELEQNRMVVQDLLRAEEERFGETLERGLRLFEEIAATEAIVGEDAFKLHDTYGFPLELTRDLALERGLTVDEEGFERLMAEQRERSRRTSSVEVGVRLAGAPKTDFVGYEKTEVLTAISALGPEDGGRFRAKLHESPFYPEGGGQVSDQGFIENEATGARAELVEAVKIGDDQELVFQGAGFAKGDRIRAVVPWSVRFPTMTNHTATHLLHAALREVLGDHVRQAGSAVRPDKLRFDFTHGQGLSAEERAEVEHRVNDKIFENLPVRALIVPIDEARRLGAMMLFGEKYGDEVRMLEVGEYSRELCGGTHVRSTAEIGPFVILSEGSVGSGVRRIEALTSREAYEQLVRQADEFQELRAEMLRREKPRQKAPAEQDLELRTSDVGGQLVVVARAKDCRGGELRDLSDRLRQSEKAAAVVLGSVDDGRAYIVLNLDKALTDRGVDAVAIVREAASRMSGGGGGRADLAEAGGKEPEKLLEALEEAERLLTTALSA